MIAPINPCRCCGKVPYIDDITLPARIGCEQLYCNNTNGVEGATAELAAARWNEQNPIRTSTGPELPTSPLGCEVLNHLEDSHRNQIGDEILRGLLEVRLELSKLIALVGALTQEIRR